MSYRRRAMEQWYCQPKWLDLTFKNTHLYQAMKLVRNDSFHFWDSHHFQRIIWLCLLQETSRPAWICWSGHSAAQKVLNFDKERSRAKSTLGDNFTFSSMPLVVLMSTIHIWEFFEKVLLFYISFIIPIDHFCFCRESFYFAQNFLYSSEMTNFSKLTRENQRKANEINSDSENFRNWILIDQRFVAWNEKYDWIFLKILGFDSTKYLLYSNLRQDLVVTCRKSSGRVCPGVQELVKTLFFHWTYFAATIFGIRFGAISRAEFEASTDPNVHLITNWQVLQSLALYALLPIPDSNETASE